MKRDRLSYYPVIFLTMLVISGAGFTYELSGEEWESGAAAFSVNFEPEFQTIVTDPEVWNDGFRDAMAKWTTTNQFRFNEDSSTKVDPCVLHDPPQNSADFTPTNCGSDWGGTTIAFAWTFTQTSGADTLITQGGIMFNDLVLWDVYDGGWGVEPHTSNGGPVGDFRRVAVHELGHIVGLAHPCVDHDANTSTPCIEDPDPPLTMIMRAVQGDGETIIDLQADDIAGAVAIYDLDSDGYGKALDNCATVANPSQMDTNSDGEGDACDSDDDGDTIPDTVEIAAGMNPLSAADAAGDIDADGINNRIEYQIGTQIIVHDSGLDPDADGLTNLQEVQTGTNINNQDSDGDGIDDGTEVAGGRNPLVNESALLLLINADD